MKYFGKAVITQRYFAWLFGVDTKTVERWIKNGNIAVDDRVEPYRIIVDNIHTLNFLFNRRGRIDSKVEESEKEKEANK